MKTLVCAVAILGALGCADAVDDAPSDRTRLTNSVGKDDSASVRVRMTESSPYFGMGIGCDAETGCTGWLDVQVRTPDGCTLLDDARCGIGRMEPKAVPLAKVVLTSQTEGARALNLIVETQDGSFVNASVAVPFSVLPGEEIDIELTHLPDAPDVTLNVRATWEDAVDPSVAALEEFLASQPGLSFAETETGYPGVRAYELYLEQPLDHEDPSAGSFMQRAILHHRDAAAPMVLYTSGYQWGGDYQAELTEALGANQLDTEQRFFGVSVPTALEPAHWDRVTIKQAAADHHRFVTLLKPFYNGTWLSTGHSKGGMTSVFHRRFYPDDVDLTVAYVAPISFAPGDRRYIPFLDAIGTDDCREAVRDLQRATLERMDDLLATWPDSGAAYALSGGLRGAIEESVETLEWGFWQASGVTQCPSFTGAGEVIRQTAAGDLWTTLNGLVWPLNDDEVMAQVNAYDFQAAYQLGYQAVAGAHLDGLLEAPGVNWHTPEGTSPAHDPSAMEDIQDWVLQTDAALVFLYGEYDPWTGGAFDVPDTTLKVVAPAAHHGAFIADLEAADREAVLDEVEAYIGDRPAIDAAFTPSRAPRPAFLLERF